MSIFKTVELPCPTCATRVSFELVHSVNADRRPDLRQAVLDRSFQRAVPACGLAFAPSPNSPTSTSAAASSHRLAVKQGDWKAIEQSQAMFDSRSAGDARGARSGWLRCGWCLVGRR
jgi:hypothetical protein